MAKGKQKTFLIRIKKIKDLNVGTHHQIRARTKEIAKRKFKRTFLGRQKITGVTELK